MMGDNDILWCVCRRR